MPTCLVGLGSNLGDRRGILDRAVRRLGEQPDVRVTARSGWYETAPVGGPPGQGPFLNGVAVIETSLEPEAVLAVLQGIERDLGRRRAVRWGPRQVDLDLLLYDQLVLATESLTLPHPRMAWRRFVLEPAAEVAGALIHPAIGWSISRLLEHLNTATPYVAIAGPIAVGKTRLAQELTQDSSVAPARTVQRSPMSTPKAARSGDLPRPFSSFSWIVEKVARKRLETFYADPSGNAWGVEIEFLRERARLLAADLAMWSEPGRLWVSDFWFPQGLAYARVWLPPERWEAYREQWETARRGVVEPKLTVLLDASAGRLLDRIRRRGRPGEGRLTQDRLERIRQAILTLADEPGWGPMLRLSEDDPAEILAEVSAAMEAMR